MELWDPPVGNLLVRKSSLSTNRKFILLSIAFSSRLICFFFHLKPLADVVKHVEKGYRMEKPEGCPREIHDLMQQAWDLNADRRPTFNQVKQQLAQLKDNPNFV